MARIAVKTWWYKKEQSKANGYSFTLIWDAIYDEEKDPYHAEEPIGYLIQGEEVRETEKAKNFTLDFWNLRKGGRDISTVPIERRWKTWIPKSVILDVKLLPSRVDDHSYKIKK